ncbi:dehydrogenase [Candidatus Gottesmanbacteria bacterium RBG_16_52_11]|uniref:Dehydrogenase n=1 Tax=Candidatus Gottesmanbacteria bacterium RBG_16_52_11 TaxID=1798374 RepID=A0A1F5YW10_9BACT|nr:MAG: dehydrogenase [Candidatus Gottesmanbacteria bacterium RBG_16_52_11]
MKAAILTELKKPLVVADIDLPKTPDYGQVLVRVRYSGICGAQLNEIDGAKGPDKFLPHLLGHEGGGVVEKVGQGVTQVKRGDHVVLHWRQGRGIQSATPVYRWGKKKVNAGWVTTFNEYAVVSENRVTPIPRDYSLESASLYGCAITSAFGVVHNDAGLKSGESIIIYGAGGVGSAIILAARVAGANPIVAVDILDSKLNFARTIGATHTLNGSKTDIEKAVRPVVGDAGADVTVDTTGIAGIRELAYRSASPAGRTVLVGVPRKGETMSIDSFPLHFDKVLTGSHGGDADPAYDIPRLIRLERTGAFDPAKLITKTYPLDRINEAIAAVRNGSVIRAAVKMDL